ncbi:MAG TPA: adenylate/guanylate cyclase domain-containing protein [Burkholderiales bacterium]|jgi:adenylate cyclase
MQPERRPAALLFAELRNFTRMSEVLEAGKVLALANEFFSAGGRVVKEHSGKLLSVQNDSLLAAFTAGTPAQFAGKAVQAALVLQREFGALGERWQTEYGLPAAIALGVHCGETVFGMAGPQGAQQYVAFGDCVSVAERLVHRARLGEIVLSIDVMKTLGAEVSTLGAEELPPLEIAKRPAIPIYGLVLETRLDFT